MFRRTRDAVSKALGEFSGMSADAVRRQRQDKFMEIGRNL
jgi:acetyl-CoA carboxylase alpha subunit